MNLTVYEILKHLNAANIEDENSILEYEYNMNGIVSKVNKRKYIRY